MTVRRFWITLCVGIWLIFPEGVWAQSSSKTSGVSASGIRLPVLRKPAPESGQVTSRVREWFRLWRQGKRSAALQMCSDIQKLQRDLGIENLFLFSSALLRLGDTLVGKGEAEVAKKLYDWANKMAPAYSLPYFRLSWMTFRYQPGKMYLSFPLLWKGWKRRLSSPFEVSVFSVELSRYLGWTLGLSFALLWFFLLLRCLRPLLVDFSSLFPTGVTSFQMSLLSLLLLFLPLLMGAGLLEALLCWVFFAWFYQSTRERVLTTTGLLLLSALPYFLFYVGKFASIINSPVEDLYRLNVSAERTLAARRLERYLQKNSKSLDVLWSLGLYYKRRGRNFEARRMFSRALKVKAAKGLRVNLGNLDFLEQEPEKAFLKYRKALIPEGMFNLSQLLKHSTAIRQEVIAEKVNARSAALSQGGARVENFEKQVQPQINRYIMDVSLPKNRYWKRLLEQEDRTALQARVWGWLSSWIPLAYAPWTGVGVAILLWLLAPLGRRSFRGRSCEKCGTVFDRDQNTGAICAQCKFLFQKKEGSSARKVQKEFEIQRHQRRRYFSKLALSVLVMGSGQILQQKAIKGFFLLLLLTTTIYLWLFPQPLLSNPMEPISEQGWWLAISVTAITLVLYVFSVREAWNDD